MLNKLPCHISDLAFASYTGVLEMSRFVPNNLHLQEVVIIFFQSNKMKAEGHQEL